MVQPPAKKRRLSADIDLTADEDLPAVNTGGAGVGEGTAKKSTFAPLFRPPAPSKGSWQKNIGTGKGCGHFVWDKPAPSTRIAAFDIDGTLIRPKDGRRFPRNDTDWEWLNTQIVPKLRRLHAEGSALVFFSNQGLRLDSRIQHFQRKMLAIARVLDIPLRVFAAFEYNEYRKPSPGMWNAFVEQHNGGVSVNLESSFFVGDAAGRPLDHSDTDRKFALNCGLPFFTPEEFFLSQPGPASFTLSGWNARSYDHGTPLYSPPSPPLLPRRRSEFDDEPQPEVVILVGFPSVGKTSFYRTHFAPKGYLHVNQDTLRTRAACLEVVRQSLTSSPPRSVVVDNTSPSSSVRAEYLALVRSLNIPGGVRVRCFHFIAPIEVALHNSVYRALFEPVDQGNGRRREVLPLAAFLGYKSKLETPKLDEGFDDLKRIQFKFTGTPEQLQNWQLWLGDVYGYKPAVPKPVTAKRGR